MKRNFTQCRGISAYFAPATVRHVPTEKRKEQKIAGVYGVLAAYRSKDK